MNRLLLFWKKYRGGIKYALGISVFAAFTLWIAHDAIRFHLVTGKDKKNVWIHAQWYSRPYTHLVLLAFPKDEYWTENSSGTERLRVREVKVGEAVYWMTLERKKTGKD